MVSNVEKRFQSLMNFEILDGQPVSGALQQIGLLIDVSSDLGRPEGTKRAITLLGKCLDRGPSPEEAAVLHYFAANAWSHLHNAIRSGNDSIWEWDQPELENQLVHLRRGLRDEGFSLLPDVRRCQIATNYGNVLSEAGRFVDAIESWNRALAVNPHFSMALGNRGTGFVEYARILYDPGHQQVFLRQAHIDLTGALKGELEPGARSVFERYKRGIEKVLPPAYLRTGTELDDFSLGRSNAERNYRRWSLAHHLFLNPLNDLGSFPIAAHDVFSNPSMAAKPNEGPTYHGFFNQMKQEFVHARFRYHQGIMAKRPHFADRHVLLYNTFDYSAYCLAVEDVKIAFRVAYSLFDKVAYFLNDYFGLGIPERRVTFRSIWYTNEDRTRGVKPECVSLRNWPLRGLFWLSKDLFEPDSGFQSAIEPDAQELNEIRNHLEHKYLKIHEMWSRERETPTELDRFRDRLAYSVQRQDFETKTLRILKHARAALIYLSLAVHNEERRRRSENGDGAVSVPLYIGTFDDRWNV